MSSSEAHLPLPETTFEQWAFHHKQWSDKTLREYRIRIAHAERHFRSKGESLLTGDLKGYFFRTKPTASNRNNIRSALIAWFDYKEAEPNPARALPRLKVKRRLPRPLPSDKLSFFLKECWDYSNTFGALATVLLYTGLRLQEVRCLRWDQVYGEWAHLIQKGGQERAVYLRVEVAQALRTVRNTSDWCFPSPVKAGRPIGGCWIERKMNDLALRSGMVDFKVHRLRHTFGTTFYRQTKDLLLTKEALGHQSIQNTLIYAASEPEGVREGVEQMRFF